MKKRVSKIIISLFAFTFLCTPFIHGEAQEKGDLVSHQGHQKMVSQNSVDDQGDNINCCESHQYDEGAILVKQFLTDGPHPQPKIIFNEALQVILLKKFRPYNIPQNNPPPHLKTQISVLQLA